jgi:glycosyltransferase involved in cell wall biosynthesis
LIGENSKKYIDLAKTLEIEHKITFIEHIPHNEVVKHLQKADVLVLFSNYENLPCVILESFSCGTPVISTNVGGISEFFPKEFGFLITPKDENQLLEQLKKLYNKPILKKEEMHDYAVINFDKKNIAITFSNLYQKIVDCI